MAGDDQVQGEIDYYREAILATAEIPVVFVGQQDFNLEHFYATKKIDTADIEIARNIIDEQLPGAGANFSDEELAGIVERTLIGEPRAMRMEIPSAELGGEPTPFALAYLQGENQDHHDEFLPGVASMRLESLRPIPGTDENWDIFWGIHEGTHANQPIYNPEGMDDSERSLDIMFRELRADRAGIEWLRSEGHDDMAQALIDYRALSASSDVLHGLTAILADQPDVQPSPEIFKAALSFEAVMETAVAADLGLSEDEINVLKAEDPNTYMQHVERLHAEGVFADINSNPYISQYIDAYVGAVQRQVVNMEFNHGIDHIRHGALDHDESLTHHAGLDGNAIPVGQPVVTLGEGDVASTMKIGDASIPDFFAIHMHGEQIKPINVEADLEAVPDGQDLESNTRPYTI